MAASREVVYLQDFRGGLNLTNQTQSLRKDETPDALNIDFGLRGGIILRGGFQSQAYDADLLMGAALLGATYWGEDVVHLCAADGELLEWNGTTLTAKAVTLTDATISTPTGRPRMAVFNNKNYFANCYTTAALKVRSWDDSTLTTLTNTFNDDYLAPAGGNMPLARHVASHQGFLWVADTEESAVRYPHRLRWSHLQQPEDWATADYVDCDPSDDGDPITAIVPFKDVLLVFKRAAVYAIYGSDRDTFLLERLTVASGVSSTRSVAISDGKAYWFSIEGQLMEFDGRSQPRPVSDKLTWWVDTNLIQAGGYHKLMWANGHLYLSLATGSAEGTLDYYMFVWNPQLSSFTRYDKQAVEMLNWVKVGLAPDPLFIMSGDANLYKYDRSYSNDTTLPSYIADSTGDPIDDLSDVPLDPESQLPALEARIDGYYKTGWVTADETATKKRWKRPRVTAAADGDATIQMEVFHDFDTETRKKISEIDIEVASDVAWGSLEWGLDLWPATATDVYSFSRQPSAGSAMAVQFKFSSPDNVGRWWIDSIAVPFRRKKVK